MSKSPKSRNATPEAQMPQPHDVLIVGGGLVGLTLALALAAHEIDVGLVTICALPLKFKNSDGAPARVIAILDR